VSNNEARDVRFEKVPISPELDKSYKLYSGYDPDGAAKLQDMGVYIDYTDNKVLGYKTLSTKEDLTDTITRYNDWVSQMTKTDQQTVQYLDGAKARPGRRATVLSPDTAKTVLGAPSDPSKTVLG
jgi:hypothetical protein